MLKPNDRVENFKYTTPYKEGLDFYNECQDKKSFLIFSRYYGCTFSQLDISDFIKNYSKFVEKDVKVFIVLQSEPSLIRDNVKEEEVPFDFICDPDMKLYKKYNIVPAKSMEVLVGGDIKRQMERFKEEGIEHGVYEGEELQLPAIVLLKEGEVLYSKYGKHITDMPTIQEMLEMV